MRTQALLAAAIAMSTAALGCGSSAGEDASPAVTPRVGGPAETGPTGAGIDGRALPAPTSGPDAAAPAPPPLQSRPEVRDYLAALNAACASRGEPRRLFAPPPPSQGLSQLVRYARRTLPRVQRRYERLTQREPPESFRDPMQAVLQSFHAYATVLQQLATQSGDGRSAGLAEQLRPAAEMARSQAALAGLPACA